MATSVVHHAQLTHEFQATVLWTYIRAKTPRFTSEIALEVVQELNAQPGEDLKRLAKRLRPLVERHSVGIKHAASLEVAARILGHPSWHGAKYEGPAPVLKLIVLSGSGNGTDMFTVAEEAFYQWPDLVPRMAHWCDERLCIADAKIFQVQISSDSVMVGTPVPRRDDNPGDIAVDPLFLVRPQDFSTNWLDGAPTAFEALRRHLEECGRAVLDGVTVLQLLHEYSRHAQSIAVGVGSVAITNDAPNTELVLLREDSGLKSRDGWEIARGDELTCWAQFELAMKDHEESSPLFLDGEAWRIGRGRYVWEMHTIHPKEYVPGLTIRRLSELDVERLLRRYKLVRAMFSGKVRHHEVNKRVEYLGGPKDAYRVDTHRLLLVASKAGHTWESLCEVMGVEEQMRAELPLGFIMKATELLSPKDPNQFFARPSTSEMALVEDDLVLRTLLPRVDTVRYRLGGLPEDLKQVVCGAINDLIDSLRVRKMGQAGMFADENELPQLVYANDGEELRLKLQEHGLILYAGALPHFFPLDGIPQSISPESLAPFAFGHCLYLHIEAD